jgi:desampylase
VLVEVVAHAREAAPAECCGLLLGVESRITDAIRIRNVADSPTRYQLDPAEHIAARRQARERGLDVVGFYHSHPDSPATPSATDVSEAEYPGHAYLIVGLGVEPADVRLFRWDGRRFEQLELEEADAKVR